MKRNIEKLISNQYDLIVIGGGIFGACAAWDATLRGLSTALIDKDDFSGATSANHFKMVHGGIRYLQHGDILRIRESSRERTAFLKIAPHLVRPLPIVIPTYGHGRKGRAFLGTGMLMYDLLTIDRNRSLQSDRRIPNSRFLTRDQVVTLFPGIKKENLTGAAMFYDGQMYNPPRVALSFIRSAVEHGADAANYVQALGFLKENNRIPGIRAADGVTGRHFEIRGRCILNAAGPWAHRLLESDLELHFSKRPAFSRDLALVLNRRPHHGYALAFSTPTKDSDTIVDRGGRHLFAVPWRDYTLIGVWHKSYTDPPDGIFVEPDEIAGFVSEVNQAYPGLKISMEEISLINTGLTLFGKEERQKEDRMSFGKRSMLLDHESTHGLKNLVTLIGVRATTARGMASKAIDLVMKKIGIPSVSPDTEKTHIYGGDIDGFAREVESIRDRYANKVTTAQAGRLTANYGSRWPRVMKYLDPDCEKGNTIKSCDIFKAETRHATCEEMALHLKDTLFRRTDTGTGCMPSRREMEVCAAVMSEELGWDEETMNNEIESAGKNPYMSALAPN